MNTSSPNRREFLQAAAATAAVPFLQPTPAMASPPPSRRPWKWAPEPGLWETVCGDDVVAQLHAAADAGFVAFSDPQIMQRSPRHRDPVYEASQRRGMRIGPFRGPTSGYRSFSELVAVFAIAGSCGVSSARVEVLEWGNNQRPILTHPKRNEATKLIRSFVAGATDTWNEQFPDRKMLPILWEPSMQSPTDVSFLEAFADILHEVNHPLCRLSIDTYRLTAAGIDVVDYMQRHADIIGHVELADFPGGYEPGSGSLDIAGIVAATALSPHDGVIGLRCGLSQPGPDGISRLIAAARQYHGLREDAWT